MNTPTKDKVGKLIAHWRRKPNDKDVAAVRNIVQRAVLAHGIRGSVEIATYGGTPSLGFGGVRATIRLDKPVNGHRDREGTLYSGISKITVYFSRCAGLYSFEEHCRRQNEEAAITEKMGGFENAREAIDSLHWDAEALHFSARTDGQARAYRHRLWYPFEGVGHFAYDSEYKGLGEQFAAYVGNLAHTLGISNKAVNYLPPVAKVA